MKSKQLLTDEGIVRKEIKGGNEIDKEETVHFSVAMPDVNPHGPYRFGAGQGE